MPIADVQNRVLNVCFVPIADIGLVRRNRREGAHCGHWHLQKIVVCHHSSFLKITVLPFNRRMTDHRQIILLSGSFTLFSVANYATDPIPLKN